MLPDCCSTVSAGRSETAVASLGQIVGAEALDQVALPEVVLLGPGAQGGELLGVVAVVDLHRVAGAEETVLFEPLQTAHSDASDVQPVSTSAPQLGQVASSISPTMKLKPHSGHSSLGDGGSGGGGDGGVTGACGIPSGPV